DCSPQHDSQPPSHQTIILSPAADEPASLLRDDRHGEAFPTVFSLDAGQDRENIAKISVIIPLRHAFLGVLHSPFDLEVFSDSDYARASLDRKYTTGGCQVLRKRLISWQCKKQTIVANLTTEAEYVAATNCCGQFWQTATTRTLDNGEMEITTTIDGKVKVVTEASVRRHLKLEDSNGISIFLLLRFLSNLHLWGLIFQGERSTVPVKSHHTPTANEAASISVDVRHGEAATTITSLDAGHGSGNMDKTPSVPYDLALLRVNILGSDEGRMQHNELMDLVTQLSDKVLALEEDLKQTKKVYGATYTKLIMKVKKLEKIVKTRKARRKAKIVVSDEEVDLEDPFKQGRSMIEEINQDAEVTLVTPTQVSTQGEAHSQEDQPEDQLGVLSAAKVLGDTARRNVQTYTKRMVVSTGSGRVSTASRMISIAKESVSTASASMPVSTSGVIDKAVRLQEEFDKKKRQRIARVHEAAQTFTKEEWENIRARVEAERANSKTSSREKEQSEAKRKKPMNQAQQRTYMSNYIKHMRSYTLKQLKKLSFYEIKELFEATMRSIKDFVPMESEDNKEVPKLEEARSSKRDAEEELDQGRSKKQKIGESLEPRNKEIDELSQEELQKLMIIVSEQGMNVEALQTKYPIID
nr:putative ribonuclease H-like domain-containing protein [Tanacetum cinerariifolium]